MPPKPAWLLHIPEIVDLLAASQAPVVDRTACERIFGLGRRRAIDLMQKFGGYRAGNSVLLDRQALIHSLQKLEGAAQGRSH